MSDWKDERVGELSPRRKSLPVDCYIFPEHWGVEQLLRAGLSEIIVNQKRIIKNQGDIVADLSKLKTIQAKLATDVGLLLADTTSQADVDSITDGLTSLDNQIVAVLPPPTPAP